MDAWKNHMSNKISLKRNVFFNALKQCCSVILPLFTFSYVSRTLGKEQYGVYSFSLSVVGYFVLFAGLGINTYSVREHGNQFLSTSKRRS